MNVQNIICNSKIRLKPIGRTDTCDQNEAGNIKYYSSKLKQLIKNDIYTPFTLPQM